MNQELTVTLGTKNRALTHRLDIAPKLNGKIFDLIDNLFVLLLVSYNTTLANLPFADLELRLDQSDNITARV